VHHPGRVTLPADVLRLEVAVAQDVRQITPPKTLRRTVSRLDHEPRDQRLIAPVQELHHRPRAGVTVIPPQPVRIR